MRTSSFVQPACQLLNVGSVLSKATAICLAVAALATPALADSAFPSKPITLIVPYAAGGPTDVTARRLAEIMSRQLKSPVLVDNKTGAATIVAAEYVARAPKDGYTLMFAPRTSAGARSSRRWAFSSIDGDGQYASSAACFQAAICAYCIQHACGLAC